MPRVDDPGPVVSISRRQVHAFRLARHHLDRPVPKTRLTQVVADACGIQAQVMAAAQLALRARVRGLSTEDVDHALWRDRSLARVWCMRGTVHLVPSNQFAVFVRGSGSRQEDRVAAWLARTGASKADLDRLIAAASAAMDRPRTRREIAEHVRDSLGWPIEKVGRRGWGGSSNAPGFRFGRAVVTIPGFAFAASYRGLVCFGPDEGKGTTFVRPDAWLREWRDLSVADAEDALLRRYLRSFGPATVSDFAAWSVLTIGRVRQIWSRLEDELSRVEVDGRVAWLLRRDLSALEKAQLDQTTVRLLPYFDTYLMGHKDRGHLVDAAQYSRVYRTTGWVYPVVLLDGRVAGEWSHEQKASHLQVRVRPYVALDGEAKHLIREEADDVARFLSAPEAWVTFVKAR